METIDMNGYGSHLPLLDMLFKSFKIKKVIEFGCGDFSTSFFLSKNASLISIEMQDPAWADKISKEHKIDVHKCIGPHEYKKLAVDWKCDLAFIDGHAESRPEVVNFMFGKAKIIVAHDYQKTAFYGWQRMAKHEDYHMIIFAADKRSSVCFIHNSMLLNKF